MISVHTGSRKSVPIFVILLSLFILNNSAYAELYMSISGTVRDVDSAAGLSGAQVTAIMESDSQKSYSATSDNNGNFVLKFVPSGAYDLFIDSPSKYVMCNKPYKVTVEKGKNIVGLDIRLERGGSISGKVFQSDGKRWPGLFGQPEAVFK